MSPRHRLGDLAARLGREVEGDGEFEVRGVAALESAGPDDLSFVRSPRFAARMAETRAGALIVPPDVDPGGRPAIRSPDPGRDFARAVRVIAPRSRPEPGVHASAVVAPDARVDPAASVGPLCVIGAGAVVGAGSVLGPRVTLAERVEVGADCVIHAGCVLREETRVGDRCVLQPGVVIGGDGFGYVFAEEGRLEAVPQVGRVVLEDDVEVGANATIDRATLGETRIGRGSKIDNLVQVGHNCELGEDVVLVAQSGLSGSTRVARGAVVLAQAGAAGHLRIGERAVVGPQSGVHRDVPDGAHVIGSPERDERSWWRMMAALAHLPGLLRRVRAIERRLGLRPEREGGAGD